MTFISNYPPVTESDIKGKPYVTVSAKGIANGLSDIPNDGADFGPDTPGTQTSGIQEAINYARSFANPNTAFLPEIHLTTGTFLIHQPIYLKYTSTVLPVEVTNASTTGNYASVSAPSLIGYGNINGQYDYVPTGAVIKAASDFPKGEYMYALLLPTTAWYSGQTNPQWVGGKLENIIFDNNFLGAGITLMQFGNGNVSRISIRDPIVPNPNLTLAPDSTGQSYQTGAFVYTQTQNSGEFTDLRDIQIRNVTGPFFEDGFVLNNGAGLLIGENLWLADGALRYGFNLSSGNPAYPMILINPECDMYGGWTGSVPLYNPTPPQSAGYFINSNTMVSIINNNTFLGMHGNYPYVYSWGNTYIKGGYYMNLGSGYNNYVFVTPYQTFIVEDARVEYNSANNGVFIALNGSYDRGLIQSFRNIIYKDDNTGTPSYRPYNFNLGPFGAALQSRIYVEPFVDSQGRYLGGFSPSLSANPPVSGTIYQNSSSIENFTKIKIFFPVYASTSGTAGSVSVAMGNNSSGTNPPTIPTLYTKFINGSTSSSSPEIIELEVPFGWYYSFTGTGVTFGTATVEAV